MKKTTPLSRRAAQDWVLVVLTLMLAVLFFTGLNSVVQRVFCPVQVQQTESYMVDRARLFFTSESLYPDPAKGGPYILTAYPPVYFFLQAVLLKVTGGVWLAGRLLSLVGYWGCGFLIWRWGRNRWGRWPALSTALLFLLSPTWALWGSMVRPDTLALLFQFLAFLILFGDSIDEKKGESVPWKFIAAGLLAGAAVCVKQTAISLWLAYGLYAVIKKDGAGLKVFAAGCLTPVAIVGLWEEWSTDGMFLKHTGLWLDTGYDLKVLEYFFFHVFLKESWVLVLAAGWTFFYKTPGLLLKCQIFFSSIQLLSLGRNGGAENYFLEFWLYGILLVAEGNWEWFGRLTDVRKWAPALFLLAVYASLAGCPWPAAPSAETIRMKQEAAKMYRTSGPYLALDLDLPLMAGNRIWYQPVEYQYLLLKGRWDPGSLLTDIRQKKFTSIELYDIPDQYLMPAKIVSEIEKSYPQTLRKYGRVWYLPN